MYFSSAEEWGNVGHKDNIVIESPFLIPSCVLCSEKPGVLGAELIRAQHAFFPLPYNPC